MSSNYTTSSYTGFLSILFPYHLFTKNKNSKSFINFICFQKSVRGVNGSIFLATLYSVNESLSGVSIPKDLEDESVSERFKKFLKVKKIGKFNFISKF